MNRRRSLFAVAVAAAASIGWIAGADAQTANPPLPPLPPLPAAGSSAQQGDAQAPTQQAATAAPTDSNTMNLPPLPLGHDGIREVQTQLLSLGFNPGPADGQNGPATLAAAQQYYESRGGTGPVTISPALLMWLQQDTGPRLTPQQVAARSQPRYRSAAPDPLTGAMQQLESGLRSLFNGG